jgi:hypothetical protein
LFQGVQSPSLGNLRDSRFPNQLDSPPTDPVTLGSREVSGGTHAPLGAFGIPGSQGHMRVKVEVNTFESSFLVLKRKKKKKKK